MPARRSSVWRLLLVPLAAVGFLFASACFHGPEQAGEKAADFRSTAKLINATIRANHYQPASLDNDTYRQIESDVVALGETASSADEFMKAFNGIWQKGPFSHVALRPADGPAADRIASLDTMVAGDGAVTLVWEGAAAILTVNTMNGADTIDKISAAYDEIARRGAEKLVIDLRRNTGGAFAVMPLVGHLISEPIDAGVFVSRLWYRNHEKPPGPSDFPSATPWRGYSVKAFQADMLSRPLTSYRIDPMRPLFQGPVFVLTSAHSISAAEIAADVLKATGRGTVIGEKTPGALLSSSRFDIPSGFHLIVPIADYYSIRNGRIERVGVTPDTSVKADQALDVALGLGRGREGAPPH
jgi:carboxyl-terminal processing protease